MLASQLRVDPVVFSDYLHGRDTTRRAHVFMLQRDFGFRSFSATIYRELTGHAPARSGITRLHDTTAQAQVKDTTRWDGPRESGRERRPDADRDHLLRVGCCRSR